MNSILSFLKIIKEILPFVSTSKESPLSLKDATVKGINELLLHPKYEKRSFKIIRKKIGAYDQSPEKLRKLLVIAGATRYGTTGSETEMWGFSKEYRETHIGQNDETKPKASTKKNILVYFIAAVVLVAAVFALYFYLYPIGVSEPTCEAIFC